MGEETSDILQPGVDITPKTTIEDSKKLLQKIYGLKCKSITELIAYNDKNYKVIVEDQSDNENITKVCKNGYVFKILNKHESKELTLIEAQKDMMLFLGTCIHRLRIIRNAFLTKINIFCDFV